MGFIFLFTERKRGCTGRDVFQSFSKEGNKEAVFLKTTDNSLLIITIEMLKKKINYVTRVQTQEVRHSSYYLHLFAGFC